MLDYSTTRQNFPTPTFTEQKNDVYYDHNII